MYQNKCQEDEAPTGQTQTSQKYTTWKEYCHSDDILTGDGKLANNEKIKG